MKVEINVTVENDLISSQKCAYEIAKNHPNIRVSLLENGEIIAIYQTFTPKPTIGFRKIAQGFEMLDRM